MQFERGSNSCCNCWLFLVFPPSPVSPELNERQHELAEDSPLFKKKVSRRMMVLTDQVDQTTSTKVVILPGNGGNLSYQPGEWHRESKK